MINDYYGNNKINKNEIDNNQLNKNINKANYNNNDSGLILPKIPKNYIRENRQLVIDNKIPLKHKQSEEPLNKTNKHKDYGKVPTYIKNMN